VPDSGLSRPGPAAVRLPVAVETGPTAPAEHALAPAFEADPAKDEQEPILTIVDDQAISPGRSPMSPA
jgi:hypothetical protein